MRLRSEFNGKELAKLFNKNSKGQNHVSGQNTAGEFPMLKICCEILHVKSARGLELTRIMIGHRQVLMLKSDWMNSNI